MNQSSQVEHYELVNMSGLIKKHKLTSWLLLKSLLEQSSVSLVKIN